MANKLDWLATYYMNSSHVYAHMNMMEYILLAVMTQNAGELFEQQHNLINHIKENFWTYIATLLLRCKLMDLHECKCLCSNIQGPTLV